MEKSKRTIPFVATLITHKALGCQAFQNYSSTELKDRCEALTFPQAASTITPHLTSTALPAALPLAAPPRPRASLAPPTGAAAPISLGKLFSTVLSRSLRWRLAAARTTARDGSNGGGEAANFFPRHPASASTEWRWKREGSEGRPRASQRRPSAPPPPSARPRSPPPFAVRAAGLGGRRDWNPAPARPARSAGTRRASGAPAGERACAEPPRPALLLPALGRLRSRLPGAVGVPGAARVTRRERLPPASSSLPPQRMRSPRERWVGGRAGRAARSAALPRSTFSQPAGLRAPGPRPALPVGRRLGPPARGSPTRPLAPRVGPMLGDPSAGEVRGLSGPPASCVGTGPPAGPGRPGARRSVWPPSPSPCVCARGVVIPGAVPSRRRSGACERLREAAGGGTAPHGTARLRSGDSPLLGGSVRCPVPVTRGVLVPGDKMSRRGWKTWLAFRRPLIFCTTKTEFGIELRREAVARPWSGRLACCGEGCAMGSLPGAGWLCLGPVLCVPWGRVTIWWIPFAVSSLVPALCGSGAAPSVMAWAGTVPWFAVAPHPGMRSCTRPVDIQIRYFSP